MIARSVGGSPTVELDPERKLGGRIIRRGDVVTIAGHGHARVYVEGRQVPGFRVLGFRGDEVHVFGSVTKLRAEAVRTFTVDRIGRRPRLRK